MTDTDLGYMGQHGLVSFGHSLLEHNKFTNFMTLDLSGAMLLGSSGMR